MKNVALSALAVLCLALTVGQPAAAQEKYTLKNAYPPGQYEMVMNIDMDMTMEMFGAKVPMKQKQTQYIAIDAAEKSADGTQQVVMEITRIVLDSKNTFMNLKYDSADPDADSSLLKAAGVIVGLKLTTVFDKDGNPVKLEGMDEFFDKLLNNPDYPKPVAEMLKKQMADKSMTKMVDMARDMMPKEPVAVGETWKTEGSAELPMLGQTKTSMENTLTAVKTENGRKIAVVLSKMTQSSEEPMEIEATPGAKVTFTKMNITGDTTMMLDLESGLMLSSEAEMEMDMEMSMEMSINADTRTLEQKISGKGQTTVTVTPKSD